MLIVDIDIELAHMDKYCFYFLGLLSVCVFRSNI